MELNTLLWIACTILYILLAWRFYDGLNVILPHQKWANVISSIFWPGFIVVILAMVVVAIIVGIGVALFLAGAFAVDLIRALIKGKPIEEYEPEMDEFEEEEE
jgi:MFS superfamily sulfate permease-like transporter